MKRLRYILRGAAIAAFVSIAAMGVEMLLQM